MSVEFFWSDGVYFHLFHCYDKVIVKNKWFIECVVSVWLIKWLANWLNGWLTD